MWIYIYIYIYIHCDPQTNCFFVYQIFSEARHVGRLKLGSKLAQVYVKLSIRPLSHQADHVSSGILRHYIVAFFVKIFDFPDTRVLNSFEELCIMRAVAVNSFARVLNPSGGAYIYIYTEREREREREREPVDEQMK